MNSSTTANAAKKAYQKQHRMEHDSDTTPVLAGLMIPDPVFFCSIEPPSLGQTLQLDNALQCLTREDPSLRMHTDSETAQTILSGMGELHLDIIRDRIHKEYNVDADLGPLQIAYRESITQSARESRVVEVHVGESKHVVNVTVSVHPSPGQIQKHIHVVPDKTSVLNTAPLSRQRMNAVNNGMASALSRGMAIYCTR